MQIKHHHVVVAIAAIVVVGVIGYMKGVSVPGETATGTFLYADANSDGAIKVVFSAAEPNVPVYWAYYQFVRTTDSGVQSIASTPHTGYEGQYEVNFTVERGNDVYYMIGDSGQVRSSDAVGTRVNDRNPPGHVQSLSAIAASAETSHTTAVVNWTASGNDGVSRGAAVAGYRVYYRNGYSYSSVSDCESATQAPNPPEPLAPGSGQTITIPGLTPSTNYVFCVIPYDAAGNLPPDTGSIPWAIYATAAPRDIGPPSTPVVSSGGIGSTNATINLTVPTDDVGVTSVEIRHKPNWPNTMTEGDWLAATSLITYTSGLAPGTQISYYAAGLTAGQWHAFGAKACDAAGNCSTIGWLNVNLGAVSPTPTPSPTPSPGGSCSSLGAGAVPTGIYDLHVMTSGLVPEIMWVVPNGATGYTIKASTQNITTANFDAATTITPSITPSTSCSTSTISIPLLGLSANTNYYIAVRPYNASGNGPISNITQLTPSGGTGGGTTPGGGSNTLPSGSAVLRIVVRDYNGSFVNNARASLSTQSGSGNATGYTSTSGEYYFPGTNAGTFMVGIDAPGRSDLGYISNQSVTIAGGTNTQEFTLPRAGTAPTPTPTPTPTPSPGGQLPSGNASLKVMVKDPTGSRVSGAQVGLCSGASNTGPCSGGSADASGEYTFSNLAPQSYTLGVGAPSNRYDLTGVSNISVTLTNDTTRIHEVSLPRTSGGPFPVPPTPTPVPPPFPVPTPPTPGATIPSGTATLRVVVKDLNGVPLGYATVGLSYNQGGWASQQTVPATGETFFNGIIAGSYNLGVSPPASRPDLGSVTTVPVALEGGAPVVREITLPSRSTPPPPPSPIVPIGSGSVCGLVFDPEGTPAPGVTVGLAQGYAYTIQTSPLPPGRQYGVGFSQTSDGNGHFCFSNIAAGSYIFGAVPPPGRGWNYITSISVTVLGEQTTNQDIRFTRYERPGTPGPGLPPAPEVPVPPPAPISTQEDCFRLSVGDDAYRRIKRGGRPNRDDMERARHCYDLVVVGPTTLPVGLTETPTQVLVIPQTRAPIISIVPPEFTDTCNTRELPRMKRALRPVKARAGSLTRTLNTLRKVGVTIPTETDFLLSGVQTGLEGIEKATTCEDAFEAGSDLPYLLDQLQDSVNTISRLRFAQSAIKKFTRAANRVIKLSDSSIRRLGRRGFSTEALEERLAKVKDDVVACKSDLEVARTALDVDGFYEKLRSCSELLGDAEDIRTLTRAAGGARAYLTKSVDAFIRAATRYARNIERRGDVANATEIRSAIDTLRARRDEVVADLKELQKDREGLLDELDSVVALMENLADLMNRVRGVEVYEEFVGKVAPVVRETVELPKTAKDFFGSGEAAQ